MDYNVYSQKDWQQVEQAAQQAIGKAPFRVKLLHGLKRTLPQNSLFHAFCNECAIRTGIKNVHWWKAYIKNKIGIKRVHIDLDEQPFVEVVSTTEYSKKQMSDLLEKAQILIQEERGIWVPLPNEVANAT